MHEQVQRLHTSNPDIAFFGDSSCLMGINAMLLSERLDTTVGNYCTLGHVGPGGYALMLERLAAVGSPRLVVLGLHPVQFQREAGWEDWPEFVAASAAVPAPKLEPVLGGLDYVRTQVVGGLIYSPIPGSYGRYYGGAGAFRDFLRASSGSAIDPRRGMRWQTEHEFRGANAAHRDLYSEAGFDVDFSLNARYRAALQRLGLSVAALGRDRVYLVVPPVPDTLLSPQQRTMRVQALAEHRRILGIEAHQVLVTPAAMPDGNFSSRAHLNRWGQLAFTRLLAEQLRPLIR